MAPKRKNDARNKPANQPGDENNGDNPRTLNDQTDGPPKVRENVRQTRSASRQLKEDTPGSYDDGPPPTKRAKKAKGPSKSKRIKGRAVKEPVPDQPVPKRLVMQGGMTTADLDAILENQREALVQRLIAAEDMAELANFDMQKQNEIRIRDEEPPERQRISIVTVNKAVRGASSFNRRTRRERHDARKQATAMYEDSLHFRVPDRRKQYQEHIEDNGNPKRRFKDNTAPVLWGDSGGYGEALFETFRSYERHHVGTTENINMPAIDPHDLFLIVPAKRRVAVGLGRTHPPADLTPINLGLDLAAIEQRRAAIEDSPEADKNVAVDGSPMPETHTQRRARQMQAFVNDHGTRTVPSNLYVHDALPTARNLDKTFLDTGVFISAGESSHNWIDSYDQTDIVKPGYLAIEPSMLVHPPRDETVLPHDPSPPPSPPSTEAKNQPDADVDGTLFEFARPKQPHKHYEFVPTTNWAESTYGRREREHAHMDMRPASPVLSPPHSPIFPAKTASHTIYVPADMPRSHASFRDYRARFKDKYHVKFQDWPAFKGAERGRGKEVGYAPLDVLALPPRLRGRWETGDPALDERGRFVVPAPEGTSMRLYREAFATGYRDPIRGGDAVEGEESDDEGDLFRLSYLECSGGAGADGGGGGGEDGGDEAQSNGSGVSGGGDEIGQGQGGEGDDQNGESEEGRDDGESIRQSDESEQLGVQVGDKNGGSGNTTAEPKGPSGEDDEYPEA